MSTPSLQFLRVSRQVYRPKARFLRFSGKIATPQLQFIRFSGVNFMAVVSGPDGKNAGLTSSALTVEVTALSGISGTTIKLDVRPAQSNDLWTNKASSASPSVGMTLEATGLTAGTAYEVRLQEITPGGAALDGIHFTATPAAPAAFSVADDFERYLWLSIVAALKASASLAGTTIQLTGEAEPAGVAEWVSIFPLSMRREESERGVWIGSVMFQITCTSLVASERADKDTARPWSIFSAVRKALAQTDVAIYAYDSAGVQGAYLGMISIEAGSGRYLSERAGEDGGDALRKNTHAVAATFEGYVTNQ